MVKVDILVEGYYTLDDTSGSVCATVTLVEDKNLRILIDPGALAEQGVLLRELEKRNLSPVDIDIVFITHSHMDHLKNIALFPAAKVLDFWGWWQGDRWEKSTGIINENITVMETPGHSYDSLTLLVKTDTGLIAVCGDVFWDESFPEKPEHDPFAADAALLRESREKLLTTADYIIPGHGGIFPVTSIMV
jgi:glyoxylase-like metal-dependent hydrolase (beta-lactamase superfamily II)